MKKVAFLLFFITTAFSFAQNSPNPLLKNNIFNYRLDAPNNKKYSLNMHPFKLENFIPNTNSLSEFLSEPGNKRVKPSDNMPIFAPEGKFFLEIYEVEDNMDFKLRIFDLEKSGYFWKNVG